VVNPLYLLGHNGPQPFVPLISLQSKWEREVRCVKKWFTTESLLYLVTN